MFFKFLMIEIHMHSLQVDRTGDPIHPTQVILIAAIGAILALPSLVNSLKRPKINY